MKTPEELFAAAKALILDFDGPVTILMPSPANAAAARHARSVLSDVDLPERIATSSDHLAVLRWTLETLPSRLDLVEAACAEAEVECARTSSPSPELPWLLKMARRHELPIGIASNNSETAVRTFADRSELNFNAYACRTPESVRLMKPHPAYVLAAASWLGVPSAAALFVGDSVSDVQAGRRAGAPVLGIAKSESRAAELKEAGTDSLLLR